MRTMRIMKNMRFMRMRRNMRMKIRWMRITRKGMMKRRRCSGCSSASGFSFYYDPWSLHACLAHSQQVNDDDHDHDVDDNEDYKDDYQDRHHYDQCQSSAAVSPVHPAAAQSWLLHPFQPWMRVSRYVYCTYIQDDDSKGKPG